MFDVDSRYYHLEDLTYVDKKGNKTIYKSRRILPQPEDIKSLVKTEVTDGLRLDQISNSMLGKPTLYWKIGDANKAQDLTELEVAGSILRIPISGDI